MKSLSLILFLIVITSCPGITQQMKILEGPYIALSGNVYNFGESEVFFKEVPIAHQYYQKAQKDKKNAKGLGYTSLASLTIGTILLKSKRGVDGFCDLFCFNETQKIGLMSVFIIFPLSGLAGIATFSSYRKQFKKAVDFYNYRQKVLLEKEPAIIFSIGTTPNGIGLTINF